jgi:hypothetical protein
MLHTISGSLEFLLHSGQERKKSTLFKRFNFLQYCHRYDEHNIFFFFSRLNLIFVYLVANERIDRQ